MKFFLLRKLSFFITIFLIGGTVLANKPASIEKKLATLELSSNGRIGILALNTANQSTIKYRADERFPFQSTFKIIAVSAILQQSMRDAHLLQNKISYSKQDIVFWSPITKNHVTEGMTIAELCSAAMMYSDNTATNLLVKKLGGPKGVNVFAHLIHDQIFRLDGWEPRLNSKPNDVHDTTTPAAMEKSLQHLTLDNILTKQQRELLISWMKRNTTGNHRIRAGVPKNWSVADKTGSGDYGITNDIAVIFPPNHAPILLVIFFMQKKKEATQREDVIELATRFVINELAQKDYFLLKVL